MSKKREKIDTAKASERLGHNPFAALAGRVDDVPRAPESGASEPVSSAVAEAPSSLRLEGKLVVRRENKGRGGKTATRITGLSADVLDELASRMKKALGCGAVVEEGDVVLLGNVQDRAIEWLEREGARRVVKGN